MSDDYDNESAPLDENSVAAGLLAEMQTEIARLNDERLRNAAEMENMRKRLERQIAETRLYAIDKFARDVLSVADNLRRGIDSAEASKNEPGVAAILTGVELTEKELISVMERHGIKRIEALGERFDPNLHQAIAEIPATGKPHGTVIEVVQPGYMIADRLLRAAMVAVAKNAPAQAAPSAANQPPPGSAFDGTA